jgi:hypothetical protein
MQQAHHKAKARSVDFCGDLLVFPEDNSLVPQAYALALRSIFHLNEYMNKQNMYVWANDHADAPRRMHGVGFSFSKSY